MKCSRNLNLKNELTKTFITQNLRRRKEYCISKKKKVLKQCQKEIICEYILVFTGCWSIFWVVVDIIFWLFVGGGGYVLAGDGW